MTDNGPTFGLPSFKEDSSRYPLSSEGSGTGRQYRKQHSHDHMSGQQIASGDGEGPVKYVLLAEFDIDQGATLSLQYPSPTGTDEHTLAELMLPDGAHLRSEDWTIFYLNQTPKDAAFPVRSHSSSKDADGGGALENSCFDQYGKATSETLFVLNCVKMKEDKAVRRGAAVKALAVCTTQPYIQIYKPLLVLALDEYYRNPSRSILAKLFDTMNSIPMQGCPQLSRAERLVLRYSERKDLFQEKFSLDTGQQDEETIMIDDEQTLGEEYGSSLRSQTAADVGFPVSGTKRSLKGTLDRFSNGGVRRMRKSSRTSMREMLDSGGGRGVPPTDSPQSKTPLGMERPSSSHASIASRQSARETCVRDTHFFDTTANYNGSAISIKIPLAALPEEVGDYSLIALVQRFSPSTPLPFPQPFHPHLHTSGASTHPIILLLNALLTEKRILFLGHGQPAGHVASFVLAACAISGHVLRGFTERAFPYSNLAGLDKLEATPGYIAGVTNPRFEDLQHTWDILCNIETGRITVSKHLNRESRNTEALYEPLSVTGSNLARDESIHAASLLMSGDLPMIQDTGMKGESPDSQFMDEILGAIASHASETAIRARFSEYIHRFVRLASSYEEETLGSSTIGFPSRKASGQQLGSGYTFASDAAKSREWASNAPRIVAWRRSKSYRYWKEDFHGFIQVKELKEIDVYYQLSRLRYAQSMPEEEVVLLYTRLVEQVRNYGQVIEFLAYVAPFSGGLSSIALGLFHPNPDVRKSVVQLLNTLQGFPVGRSVVSGLSAFQRLAYIRLAEEMTR